MTANLPDASTEPTAALARRPDRNTLRWMAHRLADPGFGTGALASLRRGDPESVVRQPSFHRLVRDVDERALSPEDGALRWATAVQVLALLAGNWQPGAPDLGTALARAGFPESRLGRLLASRGAGFRDQAVLTARSLRAKGLPCDATHLAELALVDSRVESHAERLRYRIARSYYRVADASR
jgi:hypothetical protein